MLVADAVWTTSRSARQRRRGRIATGTRQSGLALAIVLVLMVTGAIAALFAYASPRTTSAQAEELFVVDLADPTKLLRVQMTISDVRSALIYRAAMDDNRPGSLPCPDTNDDGVAELLSGSECPTYIGRLPWQTLGLPDLRDASGERLWYGLSRTLRDDDSAHPINSETPAQLGIIGIAPAANIAAVIIAPGVALAGQTRDAAGRNVPSNYLEGENVNGDTVYESAAMSTTFNDTVATLSHNQLFTAVEWRVARELRNALRRYYQAFQYFPFANSYSDATFACTPGDTRGRLPNPDLSAISATCISNADWFSASGAAPPTWFLANQWQRLTYYTVAPACAYTGDTATLNCNGAGGFLTLNGVAGIHALVIVGGRAVGSQVHPCAAAADCVEQPGAGTNQYQMQPQSAAFNDRVVVVSP